MINSLALRWCKIYLFLINFKFSVWVMCKSSHKRSKLQPWFKVLFICSRFYFPWELNEVSCGTDKLFRISLWLPASIMLSCGSAVSALRLSVCAFNFALIAAMCLKENIQWRVIKFVKCLGSHFMKRFIKKMKNLILLIFLYVNKYPCKHQILR